MREFFKTELKNLHITTGLQQYFKLSQMPDFNEQFKLLLDLLVKMCDNFPLIPDKDKEKIIQTCMIEDGDFQGFNPKILWKWFNKENMKYLPASQSQFDEQVTKRINHTPEEQLKIDALIELWKQDVAKASEPAPRNDAIKDQRIQVMKDGLSAIECKHSDLYHFSEMVDMCMDCGERFQRAAAPSVPSQGDKTNNQ